MLPALIPFFGTATRYQHSCPENLAGLKVGSHIPLGSTFRCAGGTQPPADWQQRLEQEGAYFSKGA